MIDAKDALELSRLVRKNRASFAKKSADWELFAGIIDDEKSMKIAERFFSGDYLVRAVRPVAPPAKPLPPKAERLAAGILDAASVAIGRAAACGTVATAGWTGKFDKINLKAKNSLEREAFDYVRWVLDRLGYLSTFHFSSYTPFGTEFTLFLCWGVTEAKRLELRRKFQENEPHA